MPSDVNDRKPDAESPVAPDGEGAGGSRRGWLLLGALIVLGAAIAFLPQLRAGLPRLLDWTRAAGPWGAVALVLAYIAACLLMIPGSILTLAAGFLYGVTAGTMLVSIGSTLGAGAAFLSGRYLARGRVERMLRRWPRFSAFNEAVSRQGFKIVLLTRLSPVFPFNLLNYAYGVTRVRFGSYLLASWLGMLPATVLFVYLGSTARDLAQLTTGGIPPSPLRSALTWAGLVATLVVTIVITKLARKAMNKSLAGGGKTHADPTR